MRYTTDKLKKIYDISPIWIRNLFSTGYSFLKAKREKNRYFYRHLKELRESQTWSRQQLDELQNRKLRRMIRHCAENVPYYREKWAQHGINPSQIQTKEDLSKLPLISKEEILKNTDSLIADGYSREELLPESSSGTTGKPLTVYWDRNDYSWGVAARHIVMERMGYREGKDWAGVINGYKILPLTRDHPPYWIKSYYSRKIHFSAYHLSEDTIEDYHRYLKDKSIRYLIGYASLIGLVARLMADRGLTLEMNSVLLSSEPFYQWQIDSINRAFPCRIINYFGQAERIALGSSCGESMNIHLFDEIGITEFVESEKHTNRKMVATSLVNYAMPLIRYELGDISDFAERKCECGTEHTTILPVSTKSEDFVITPDGKFISASLLTFPFKHPEGIVESQIVQENPDRITVNLNVNKDYNRSDEKKIREEMKGIMGDQIEIDFNYPEYIPRTDSGKFRFVISNVKP